MLQVRSLKEVHTCKLAGDKVAFETLPKRRRLNSDQQKLVLDVKECHGNNKALINKLNEDYGKIVTGRDIINFLRKARQPDPSQSELEQLISRMHSHGESSVTISQENNVVTTIFFQDTQMRLLYEEYPEILFCDATYKTNENRMVLMVFMNIDGNGESGLVGLCFMKSESEKCTLAALESFKNNCPSNIFTRVIMADKDMANRMAFEKVREALCLNIY